MIMSQIDISEAKTIDPLRKSSIRFDVPNLLMMHKDCSDEKMIALFNSTGRDTNHKQSRSMIYGRRTERKQNITKKLTGNFPELYQKFFKSTSSHESIGENNHQSLNSSLVNSRNLVQPHHYVEKNVFKTNFNTGQCKSSLSKDDLISSNNESILFNKTANTQQQTFLIPTKSSNFIKISTKTKQHLDNTNKREKSPQNTNNSLNFSQVFGQGLDLYASQVQKIMRMQESQKINSNMMQTRVSFNNMKIREQIVD